MTSKLNFSRSVIILPILVALLIYAARLPENPPGFHLDESSVAFNAYMIAHQGQDEFGTSWPLFFRAFGDYKNPVYIYLLALLFKIFGPGILVARILAALCGLATVAILTWLGERISGSRLIGVFVGLTALLTPWIYEISTVSLEVALFPTAIALFLLCVHRVAGKPWSWIDAITLGLSLALMSYTYSIGRLLGPLLAAGLLLFIRSARWSGLIRVWLLYGLSLLPMILFHLQNPEALTGRFKLVSYIGGSSSSLQTVSKFFKHFAGSLDPRRLLITGDLDPHQVVHVAGAPALLVATFALVLLGGWIVLTKHRRDPWWRFVVYALVASAIPASLTADYFHMLRLSAIPVVLLVLTVPAVVWLHETKRRLPLMALLLLTVVQGAYFQWQFQTAASSPWRRHLFDADYEAKIFRPAIANVMRPIYLDDTVGAPYIQAYWYGTLARIPLSDFERLKTEQSPPPGALVISTQKAIPEGQQLARVDPYTFYISAPTPRRVGPLPDTAFRAQINILDAPETLSIDQTTTIRVRVRNESNAIWAVSSQIKLGNHWLDSEGQMVTNDDGRAALSKDLVPGAVREFTLTVRAPRLEGNYVLELDMLQEGVSWFGLKGSKTVRLPVRVVKN